MSHEQLVHDKINLFRLVRRLDKSISGEHWDAQDASESSYIHWVRTEGMLQKLKYAQGLLKNVQSDADEVNYGNLRATLERLEATVKEANERLKPEPTKPPLMLPRMPQPIFVEPANPTPAEVVELEPETTPPLTEEAEPAADSLKDLLLSPSDTSSPAAAESKGVSSSTRRALQSSSAVHDELSSQLAQMATQLKRNALHFSDSLVKDQTVVEQAQQKLEQNYGFMQKERTRLRDHSGKSSSTTWLTVASLAIVGVSFIIMFFIIRLT